MPQLNNIVTITSKAPPHTCGVGDYTINLANHFKFRLNLNLNLVVETTCNSQSEPTTILPIVEDWSPASLQTLFTTLKSSNVQTIILQYTCWSYSPKGLNLNLIPFWQQCAKHFQTILVVHETYLPWSIKHPGTWTTSPRQKYLLQQLVQTSHQVFSGSEVYLQKIKQLTSHHQKLHYLPIPSNIPPDSLTPTQHQELKQQLHIPPHHHVLALFGCQESIRQDWLTKLDRHLQKSNQLIHWLLLGNAQEITSPLLNPIIRPGHLTPIQLSHHLQLADILLMPHRLGISAKRTTLMAALEHGIPVVGTDGYLTDAFFRNLSSIRLASDRHYPQFAAQVTQALAELPTLRNTAKITQAYYHNHLSWPVVTQTLSPYLKNN
jgi:glycosyltransferase involved in cell wall biosynthesis